MSYFTRNRILVFVIILLAALNLVSLGFLLEERYEARPDRKEKNVDHFFEKRLGLDDQQKTQFHEMRMKHFEEIQPTMKALHEIKREMYLNGDMTAARADSLANEIGKLHAELELAGYRHFSELRAVCRPDQRPQFDSLMVRMMQKMHRRMGHRKMKHGMERGD